MTFTSSIYGDETHLLWCTSFDNISPRKSTVYTDEWRAYNGLAHLAVQGVPLNIQHETVNHSQNFVTPLGVHTLNIDRVWGDLRDYKRRRQPIRRTLLRNHLSVYAFKRCNRQCMFSSMIDAIRCQYPLWMFLSTLQYGGLEEAEGDCWMHLIKPKSPHCQVTCSENRTHPSKTANT